MKIPKKLINKAKIPKGSFHFKCVRGSFSHPFKFLNNFKKRKLLTIYKNFNLTS